MTKEATSSTSSGNERLGTLDGMRGVAAMMVVLYHFGARWSEQVHGTSLYPHGDIFIEAFGPLQYFGGIGVKLFFLISGFVIMLTLQRCRSIVDFAGRRAARLWPTMIVCATLTTLAINWSGIYNELAGTEYWHITLLEYLSSIIFVDPALVGDALGVPGQDWADGVYWTLWTEVRFYAVVSILFWLFSGRSFFWAWMIYQSISTALVLVGAFDLGSVPRPLALLFIPANMAWFTLGIVGYSYWKKTLNLPLLIAGGLAILALLAGCLNGSWKTELAIVFVTVLPFVLFLLRSPLLNFVNTPAAITLGLASYPLYMFHERIGMLFITRLNDMGVPPFLGLALTTAVLIAFAIFLSKALENPAKDAILKVWNPIARKLEKNVSPRGFGDNEKARELAQKA